MPFLRCTAVVFAAAAVSGGACAQSRPAPPGVSAETTVAIADSPFRIVTHTTGQGSAHRSPRPGTRRAPAALPAPADRRTPLVVINVHDDENTSMEAALIALARVPARITEVKHTGARNLSIRRGAETFTVDPNRIFTDAGAALSLTRLSRMDTAMLRDVRAFADTLLVLAGAADATTIVTLHNNTDANYSARSYLPGAEYAADAAAVHLTPSGDPDDFFFVTDRPLYDALVAERFNVVLQHPETVTDDGSLSVLAARRGQRYANVEAQHGHTEVQRRMIEALVRVLNAQR
ncbi:MAG: hypothetical protein LCH53_04025 [Bacteroidetes bacterium]|nr:hypothetical protein [Bacteroidota bacterium]